MSGPALAQAALALAGAPFRLNGRDPRTGLDCLGVLAASLRAIGRAAPLPMRHSLRHRGEIDGDAVAWAAGLEHALTAIGPGDVLLARCSPVQLHVLIAAGPCRFVHAHAGLRRVVVGPLDPAWRILGRWRLAPSFKG